MSICYPSITPMFTTKLCHHMFFEHFQGWKHSIFEYLFRVLEIVFFRGTILFPVKSFIY